MSPSEPVSEQGEGWKRLRSQPVPDGGPAGAGGPRNGLAVLHFVWALPARRDATGLVGCAIPPDCPGIGPPRRAAMGAARKRRTGK